jgi:thiamine biosynthesis lipoprotein ApbE
LSLLQKKRHHYWNGKAINVNIKSKDNPALLKSAFELKLREVWRPQSKKKEVKEVPFSVIQTI